MHYDTLVIAIGGICNEFGTTGVKGHCMFPDNRTQADLVQRRLLNACLRAQLQDGPLQEGQLSIAIVGAGATGVEPELHKATRRLVHYGLDRIDPDRNVKISLIEAAQRVLPALPERLSIATVRELDRLGVRIYTGEQVVEVAEAGIRTKSGLFISAELKVWSAGVKAQEFLRDLDGLESNRLAQLVVDDTLKATRDDNIFAMGDCCACQLSGMDRPLPPRAQVAYQEARTLAKTIARRMTGKPPLCAWISVGGLGEPHQPVAAANRAAPQAALAGEDLMERLYPGDSPKVTVDSSRHRVPIRNQSSASGIAIPCRSTTLVLVKPSVWPYELRQSS